MFGKKALYKGRYRNSLTMVWEGDIKRTSKATHNLDKVINYYFTIFYSPWTSSFYNMILPNIIY